MYKNLIEVIINNNNNGCLFVCLFVVRFNFLYIIVVKSIIIYYIDTKWIDDKLLDFRMY